MSVEITGLDKIQKDLEKMKSLEGMYEFFGDEMVKTALDDFKKKNPDCTNEQYLNEEKQICENLSKGIKEFTVQV